MSAGRVHALRDRLGRSDRAAVPHVGVLRPVGPKVLAELQVAHEGVVVHVRRHHRAGLEDLSADGGVAGHVRLVGAGVHRRRREARVLHAEAEPHRPVVAGHVVRPRVAPPGHLLVVADGDVAGGVAGEDVVRPVLVGGERAAVPGEVGHGVPGHEVVGRGPTDPDALLHVVALRRGRDGADLVARDHPAVTEVAQPDAGAGPAGDVVDRVPRDDAELVHPGVDALDADVVVRDRDPEGRLEGLAHRPGQVCRRAEDAGRVVAPPAGHGPPGLPVRRVRVEPLPHGPGTVAHDHHAATDREVGDVPVAGARTEADRPVAVRRPGAAAGHLQRRGDHHRAARRREGDRARQRSRPLDLQRSRVGTGRDGDGVTREGVRHRAQQGRRRRDGHGPRGRTGRRRDGSRSGRLTRREEGRRAEGRDENGCDGGGSDREGSGRTTAGGGVTGAGEGCEHGMSFPRH